LIFWAFLSLTLCFVSAYFAVCYANYNNIDVSSLIDNGDAYISRLYHFDESSECLSSKSFIYEFVKDKKSFPIYQGEDLGVYFDYRDKYYHLIARCNENNLTLEIKEQ